MCNSGEEMLKSLQKLVKFDVEDGDFGPHFGDVVQALCRASVLGTDFLLDETEHDGGVDIEHRKLMCDSFGLLLVKVFACIIRLQERADNIYGHSKETDVYQDTPESMGVDVFTPGYGFNVPELPTLGDGVKGYNLVSDEAMVLFHRLLAERNGEASE